MLKIETDIQGLTELNKHLKFVKQMEKMKTDSKFQKFIQNKVLETVNRITQERLLRSLMNT